MSGGGDDESPPPPSAGGVVFDHTGEPKHYLEEDLRPLLNAISSQRATGQIKQQLLSRSFTLDERGQSKELAAAFQQAASALLCCPARQITRQPTSPPQVLTFSSFSQLERMKGTNPEVMNQYKKLAAMGIRYGIVVDKDVAPVIRRALVGVAEGINAGVKGILKCFKTDEDKVAAQQMAKITTDEWAKISDEVREIRLKQEAQDERLNRHSGKMMQLSTSGPVPHRVFRFTNLPPCPPRLLASCR